MTKEITYIAPPVILTMLSGVHHIKIDGDEVTLIYTDMTKQSKTIKATDRQDKEFLDLVTANMKTLSEKLAELENLTDDEKILFLTALLSHKKGTNNGNP